jgi:hypothetical protein
MGIKTSELKKQAPNKKSKKMKNMYLNEILNIFF